MKLNLEYIKRHQKQILLVLGIFAFVLLIIILIIQIANHIPSDETPRTRIENWGEELSHVPQDTRIRAEQKLYSQIEMNLPDHVLANHTLFNIFTVNWKTKPKNQKSPSQLILFASQIQINKFIQISLVRIIMVQKILNNTSPILI